MITMNENGKRKIISPQMAAYNKAAMIMAYNSGATEENAREIAGKYKIIEVEHYLEQLAEREMK